MGKKRVFYAGERVYVWVCVPGYEIQLFATVERADIVGGSRFYLLKDYNMLKGAIDDFMFPLVPVKYVYKYSRRSRHEA